MVTVDLNRLREAVERRKWTQYDEVEAYAAGKTILEAPQWWKCALEGEARPDVDRCFHKDGRATEHGDDRGPVRLVPVKGANDAP